MVKKIKAKSKTDLIRLSCEFKKWISSKGKHGESYEIIIKRLLRVANEKNKSIKMGK